jgi:FkbM family methyltransferase
MISHQLKMAKEIISNEGIKAYISHIKRCLYLKPLIDESWFTANYYLRPCREAIKTVQGSKMVLDLKDKGINRDLFLYAYREPECTKIFKNELSEGMRVADIGANIGYYVLMEAQIVGDKGKIFAIEPEPSNFEMLKRNVKMNPHAACVELYNMAISDKIGKTLFTIAGTANAHKLSIPGSKGNNEIEVATTTLDDLLGREEVNVIRMDVEGGEWLILKGMRDILNSKKPLKIFMEVHPKLMKLYGGTVESMLEILSKAWFRVKYVVVWEEKSHYLIPYIKGRGPLERKIEFNMPLADLLVNNQSRQLLICDSGQTYEAGYKLFLERSLIE